MGEGGRSGTGARACKKLNRWFTALPTRMPAHPEKRKPERGNKRGEKTWATAKARRSKKKREDREGLGGFVELSSKARDCWEFGRRKGVGAEGREKRWRGQHEGKSGKSRRACDRKNIKLELQGLG